MSHSSTQQSSSAAASALLAESKGRGRVASSSGETEPAVQVVRPYNTEQGTSAGAARDESSSSADAGKKSSAGGKSGKQTGKGKENFSAEGHRSGMRHMVCSLNQYISIPSPLPITNRA